MSVSGRQLFQWNTTLKDSIIFKDKFFSLKKFLIGVYIIFCKLQVYNIVVHNFKDYSPFIVIIKYWLYSQCCTIYPYSLFFT